MTGVSQRGFRLGRVGPRTRSRPDDGQVSILVLGLFVMVLVAVLGAIDVTAAQIARMRLLDAADTLALDAADAISVGSIYSGGIGGTAVPLTSAAVNESAQEHLASVPRPSGITDWGASGYSPDGERAVVTVTGEASLPFTGGLLSALGGGVRITVTSSATAPLR